MTATQLRLDDDELLLAAAAATTQAELDAVRMLLIRGGHCNHGVPLAATATAGGWLLAADRHDHRSPGRLAARVGRITRRFPTEEQHLGPGPAHDVPTATAAGRNPRKEPST